MMAALKVALSTSRSTGASVSPLLVARTAPEGKEKQRLALRKQVSFKTLSKLNSGRRRVLVLFSEDVSAPAEDLIRSHGAEEFQVWVWRLCAPHCACLFLNEFCRPQVASNTQLGPRLPGITYLF